MYVGQETYIFLQRETNIVQPVRSIQLIRKQNILFLKMREKVKDARIVLTIHDLFCDTK